MIAIVDATLDPYTNVYGYVTVQVIRDGVVDHDAELPSQIDDICRAQWPSPDAKGCQQDVAEARRMMVALGYTVLDGDMQPVE
tara:strand:+ start:944 stop:1192 length:249 start_codon:yes stop_codon:yes gene_type:complete